MVQLSSAFLKLYRVKPLDVTVTWSMVRVNCTWENLTTDGTLRILFMKSCYSMYLFPYVVNNKVISLSVELCSNVKSSLDRRV